MRVRVIEKDEEEKGVAMQKERNGGDGEGVREEEGGEGEGGR